MSGTFEGKKIDVNAISIGLGAYRAGKITKEQYAEIEAEAYPGPGCCQMMGSSNTAMSIAEAIGLSLPGSAAIPAVNAGRLRVAMESGIQIVDLVKKGIKARDIMTKEALENAIRVAMAIGGSTNMFLHTVALAFELGIDFKMEEFNTLSDTTPYLCSLIPAREDLFMEDYWAAGGAAAVMKELESILHTDCMTVTGKTVKDNLKTVKNKNPDVIRPISNAYCQG